MATKLSNSQYVEFDGKREVPLKNLFVEIFMGESSKLTYVSLADLFVVTGSKDGKVQTRRVTSYKDFVKNFANDKIANSESGIQSIRFGLKSAPKVQIKDIDVPETFDSISVDVQNATEEEKVSYGLRRNLNVVEAKDGDEDRYLYVIIDKQRTFVKKDEIYYYDNANKKKYLKDFKGRLSSIEGKTFYDGKGNIISRIYLEKEYGFPTMNISEHLDLEKMEKTGYSAVSRVDDEGRTIVVFETVTEKVDKYFSVQEYVEKTVADDKIPGETKEVKLIKIRNFKISDLGHYVSVTIGNTTEMVKLSNLFDEEGAPINNLTDFIGKSVQVKDDAGNLIGKTTPLTYEQVSLFYDTIKTHQRVDRDPDDSTLLRLKSGDYVEELATIQPYAFKFTRLSTAKCDAFLVKTVNDDGSVKYVIVPKDYFEKHGNTTRLHQDNARPIVRCDINDKDCVAIQTTSQEKEVEQCKIIKSFKDFEGTVEDNIKETCYQDFLASYKSGKYVLDSVFKDGEVHALDNKFRYEYTDTFYEEDYADKTLQYIAMECKDLKLKDGHVVGGPNYKIGKGIKSAFSKWNDFLITSFWPVHIAGIFIPVVGPIICTAYAVGMLAAIPAIPAINLVYGSIKNREKSNFDDKTVINRKVQAKTYKKELKKLFERMTSKDFEPLTEKRFNEEYDKLINRILSLSSTTNNNTLSVRGGKAEVNKNNAHQLKNYKIEYNENVRALKVTKKKLSKIKIQYDILQQQMETYEAEGRIPSDSFKARYDAVKEKYFEISNEHERLLQEKARLASMEGKSPIYAVDSERDTLLKVARVMKLAVYVKTFPESEYSKEALSALNDQEKALLNTMKIDFENGMFIDKLGISSNEEDLDKRYHEDEHKAMWLKVQKVLLEIDERLNKPAEKPAETYPTKDVDEDEGEVVEPEVKEEEKTKDEEKRENLERVYSEFGVTKVNKNGSMSFNRANFYILVEKMRRLFALLQQEKLTKEEKKEYLDLKIFINANRKFINKVIDERENGKTKDLPDEDYAEFYELNAQISTIITQKGGVVKHDGRIVF